jgi:L-rhamnose mutarotase
VPRVAIRLKVRKGREEDYKRTHRNVWPELLRAIKDAGIRNYSIFLDGKDLFLYFEIDGDVDEVWQRLRNTEISRKWQEKMNPILEPAVGLKPGETPRTLEEVFHLD